MEEFHVLSEESSAWGSEATERGEGVGGGIGIPAPTVGTFSKIRV